MSHTLTLALRDEIYRSPIEEGRDGGVAPEAVAVHIFEERFSGISDAEQTDTAVAAGRLEKFRNCRMNGVLGTDPAANHQGFVSRFAVILWVHGEHDYHKSLR